MDVIDVNEASMLLLETLPTENHSAQKNIILKYLEDLSCSATKQTVPNFETGNSKQTCNVLFL